MAQQRRRQGGGPLRSSGVDRAGDGFHQARTSPDGFAEEDMGRQSAGQEIVPPRREPVSSAEQTVGGGEDLLRVTVPQGGLQPGVVEGGSLDGGEPVGDEGLGGGGQHRAGIPPSHGLDQDPGDRHLATADYHRTAGTDGSGPRAHGDPVGKAHRSRIGEEQHLGTEAHPGGSIRDPQHHAPPRRAVDDRSQAEAGRRGDDQGARDRVRNRQDRSTMAATGPPPAGP